MTKVIGLNIPQQKRPEYWEAMRIFRAGSIELKKSPDTKDIAIKDEERYNRLLNLYIKEPVVAEASSNRH